MESITFFPKDGVIYSGNATDLDNVSSNQYLASLEKIQTQSIIQKSASKLSLTPSTYQFTDVSEYLGNLKRVVEKKALLDKKIHRGFSASVQRELAILESSADLSDSAISQLTIVQFVQSILGTLENVNVIAKAFHTLPTNRLRGKIPEGGAPAVSLQVDRLSEPEITHTDFGQSEFRIKRNDIHIYISREDRMEAAIDPFAFSTAQGQKQMLQARDLMALQRCALSLKKSGTYGTFEDISISENAQGVPRAKVDSVNEFLEMINGHFHEHRNYLKYIIMNNIDYRIHQTNFYVRNNMKVSPAKGFGIVPFAGLEEYGITAIISPWVPRKVGYALCDEGAYELDGPKIIDSEYDAKMFADYTPMRDFVGYHFANPKRFGEKFSLPLADVPNEAEITTDEQIAKLLKSPSVVKNDNP